ncbi:hypothetical protein SAMN04488693_11911 [Arthrobacter subterraneus]|uniref:Uncharacterized protein n=1 Tax=Arthrobacter subterraneus TaxID=335973 RepID=A0A1G8MRF7_9MICC|nr:hypothetical protein [Arthrobacter subterraneus]SDI69870.1 hypothetical protein SAMN04488693_11911 [Arthrobacter subterraneus]
MATIDLEATKSQAREILNSRIDVVSELVIARQRVNELREQLAEAEREDKKAYVRATKEGWSEDELKKLGLDNSAPAKRRSRRSSQSAPTSSENSQASSNESN